MNCKSCGKPILWAKTEKGSRIPLDPTPVPNGNIDFFLPSEAAVYMKADPNVSRFVAHFVTCPDAAKHRRKG
jgi:hypothetical protein